VGWGAAGGGGGVEEWVWVVEDPVAAVQGLA